MHALLTRSLLVGVITCVKLRLSSFQHSTKGVGENNQGQSSKGNYHRSPLEKPNVLARSDETSRGQTCALISKGHTVDSTQRSDNETATGKRNVHF